MTTLDRPSVCTIAGTVRLIRRLRCACSLPGSAPGYRRLRAYLEPGRLPALRHPGLRTLLVQHWHAVRTHSSWSRA